MATTFFYYNPLDDNNGGSSHMMCEASYEATRLTPYSAKVDIEIRFVSRRESIPQEFTYDYIIDNPYNDNGEDIHKSFTEAFYGGEEWIFNETIDFNVDPHDTRVTFVFKAYRDMTPNSEAETISGYEKTVRAYIPAWLTPPTISDPVITSTKTNQVSFAWQVTDDGSEYPTCYTEIYGYPGYEGRWIGLDELGYGNVLQGTIVGLKRYSTYGIRAYAINSIGRADSNEVWFRTLPEKPVLSGIICSNITDESLDYSYFVTDNGGKAIEKYAVYIMGGQYVDWTKVSDANSGTLTGLLHNTNYEIRGYATNEPDAEELDIDDTIFTNYTSSTITTSGFNPIINDFRAENIRQHRITLIYNITYDNNAFLKTYVIQYKKVGDEEWSSLPPGTRIIDELLSNQQYDIKLILTDNFGKTSESEIVVCTMHEELNLNKPIVTIEGNQVTVTEDFEIPNSETSSCSFVENMIFMKVKDGNENVICLKIENSKTSVESILFNNVSRDTYMHPYKTYSFYYVICDNLGVLHTSRETEITLNQEHVAIKVVKSDGTVVIPDKSLIIDNRNERSSLNYKDFVKLSTNMRYIALGSSGLYSHSADYLHTIIRTFGLMDFEFQFSIISFSKDIAKVFFRVFNKKSNDLGDYNISNRSLKIRLCSRDTNKNIISDVTYIESINELNSEETNAFEYSVGTFYLDVRNCKDFLIEITSEKNNHFDRKFYSEEFVIPRSTNVTKQFTERYCDNSLVELDVYDINGNNISLGKSLVTTQRNESVTSVNGGNATDGNHSDESKYVRANGADTIILDLGQEYNIGRIEVWRRWKPTNGNLDSNFVYSNNFIYGLNENKEICYKFYDDILNEKILNNNPYIEEESGRVFNVERIVQN